VNNFQYQERQVSKNLKYSIVDGLAYSAMLKYSIVDGLAYSAMHYGAIPVVRRTGGLAETVLDCSSELSTGVLVSSLGAMTKMIY